MILISIDTENTGAQRNKANPFDKRNKCCILCLVVYDTETRKFERKTYDFEYSKNSPYLVYIQEIQEWINKATWIAMFNAKYDMHWGKRYGLDFTDKPIWDVQLFYFILGSQQQPFPSLNDAALHYRFPTKLDIVKTEYWEQGLDTDQVPLDILTEYGEWDTELTLRCMLEQFKDYSRNMTKQQQALVKIGMKDIHNLAEMEWNGFLYDHDLSKKLSEETDKKLEEIDKQLITSLGIDQLPDAVRSVVNFNSNDHLSALLYGGVIKYVEREEYLFEYKPDAKGRAKPPVWKIRKVPKTYVCPRLFDPVPRSELAKEGYYSTNEDTLKKIKATKKERLPLDLLLERAKLDKLNGTYFKGFPKLMEEMGWGDVIHGGFNQCVTSTGRLSSTRPNLQNVPPIHKVCFKSRFT